MTIRAVDLFCGVGGLTAGLREAGIDVVAGIDLDKRCQYAYEENNSGSSFLFKDAAEVKAEEITWYFGDASRTLLAGCAPCQPFSTYSRTGEGSKDWPLLSHFGRLVKDVSPDFVTMENVPGLASHQVYRDFLSLLQKEKYHVSVKERVYCPDYGIPQTRVRLVLIASKHGKVPFPEPTHRREDYVSVRKKIEGLPELAAGHSDPSDPLHFASRLSETNMKRMKASKPGGTWKDWPADLQADCHKQESGASYQSVYGRMTWDDPAPTITTQCTGFGNGRFGHPVQDRAITLREAALLQTFPEGYKFTKPGQKVEIKTVGRFIGNAVPVRLGEVIGRALVEHEQALSR